MGFFDNLINKGDTPDLNVNEGEVTGVELDTDNPPAVEEDIPEVVVDEPEKESVPIENPPQAEKEESSLEPGSEKPVDPPVVDKPQEIELRDEDVLKVLSEKLGREVTGFDELTPEPEKVEVVKEVNPYEDDPYLKELAAWRDKTGRPIEDWIKFQKDYEGMSSVDVAREYLQYKYPDLTPEEVALEMSNYLPNEEDDDSDKLRKSLELKKIATVAKNELSVLRSEFDTPVTTSGSLTEDQKQAVEFYAKYNEQQESSQRQAQELQQNVLASISSFDKLSLELSDDFSVDFTLSGDNKKSLPEYSQMSHWKKPDGSLNYDAMVADYAFLQNRDAILKMAYEQGVARGKEQDDKDQRNVTLGEESRQTMAAKETETEGITIEGADDFFRPSGTRVRFGK